MAALRGKRYLGRLWALLLGSLWLLLLLAWRRLVGNGERAQHGELNGVVRDRVLLRMRFRVDSQRRAVDHVWPKQREADSSLPIPESLSATSSSRHPQRRQQQSRRRTPRRANKAYYFLPPAPFLQPRFCASLNVYVNRPWMGLYQFGRTLAKTAGCSNTGQNSQEPSVVSMRLSMHDESE